MKAPNKYEYSYVIQGHYGYGWEDESAYEMTRAGRIEARTDLKEYRSSSAAGGGASYRIIKRRELNTTTAP